MRTFVFLFFLLMLSVQESFSAWTGPTEVLIGGWGSNEGQFGIELGYISDAVPQLSDISSNGLILITDIVNERIKTFDQNGNIVKNIVPPVENSRTWIIDPKFADSNIALSIGGKGFFYSTVSGNLIATIDIPGGSNFRIGFDGKYYTGKSKPEQWRIYSPTGLLIKTSTTRPPELGVASEKYIAPGQYKVTVKYPDKEWGIIGAGVLPKYMRDTNGNLYGFGEVQAIRYTNCGKELAVLTMPEKRVQEISRGPAVEPKITVLEEYGSPVVAPNGDVYTWKRTPDKYSILKWTWVDDPNVPSGPDAPMGLTLMPSTTGLYLTWTASPSDPGCVTGYEIARATSAGGVGSTVATVNAGVVKYNDTTATAGTTYYYKVRAKAGSEYSPYTTEVSGKR